MEGNRRLCVCVCCVRVATRVRRRWRRWWAGGSAGVIGPCLSPRLMAIGHRLSPLYFFCSPARSFQVSRWSGALRHRIIYCCHGVTGVDGEGEGWGYDGGGEKKKKKKKRRREELAEGGRAGAAEGCQISAVEYLMEPGVFI